MVTPCEDWSGYTVMDVFGKVEVRTRDGYLSTQYPQINKTFPFLLRCFDNNGTREWAHGIETMFIHELRGMYPNAVVQHYKKKAREAESAKSAGFAHRPTEWAFRKEPSLLAA